MTPNLDAQRRQRSGCLGVAAAIALGLGLLGALATLLSMTYGMTSLGVVITPVAIVSGLFLMIGLQYFLWRGLGLIVRVDSATSSKTDRKSQVDVPPNES